jgi:hypothetical protein
MNIPVMLFIFATLVFIVASSIIGARNARKKLRERIFRSWGKPPDGKYEPGDLESIAGYFMNHKKADPDRFFIDDITWQDLDMDGFFIRLNGTETSAGEEALYRLLRVPSFDPEVLESRRKWIELLRNNGEERLKLQLILARMGKERQVNVTDYFFDTAPLRQWKTRIYKLLAAIALMSPLTLFLHGGFGALIIVLSISTNMVVHYKRKFKIEADLEAFKKIVGLVYCVRSLLDADPSVLRSGDLGRRLQLQYDRIRDIGKRGFFIFYSPTDSIADIPYEVVRLVLLKELIDYESVCRAVSEYRKELIEAYDAVGLIDSLISIASFRESVPFYCDPDLKLYEPGSSRDLEFEDIYHPLVPNPVTNSLAIDRSVLVTGSNASGKSTFLKTLAVNAILAQSFHTCLARKYSSPMFAVFTSMALRDNMKNGESYFIAEIRSIKRILDFLNDDVPCFCLIDEVLRGTNTVERIAASSQLLLQLSEMNCLSIAATHDIELTFILEAGYRNIHFQESITDDGIVFDYSLYEGRATSRNAIKLLRLMGYGDAIVDEAEKRADRFASRGSWTESKPL